MKFYIEKIYLWFSPEEKTCIPFENNKVNVIRGNSSRGKSNIFAIIDYCLMSDKPNIVEPIINECTEYYGIQFNLNGIQYSISRKKPIDGIGEDKVYMTNSPFPSDYYPSVTNKQVSDARRLLDNLFGLTKETYIYPWGKTNEEPSLIVSFRSFLMFNALTENIISSQYEFLNYKFFEDIYIDDKSKRDYLFDTLLGIDNVLEQQQQQTLDIICKKEKSSNKLKTQNRNTESKYNEYLNEAITIALNASLLDSDTLALKTENEKLNFIEFLIKEYQPIETTSSIDTNNRISELRTKLFKKQVQLQNITNSSKEYEAYYKEIEHIEDSLKPTEYLKQNLQKYGITIWSKHIISELETSLKSLKSKLKPAQDLKEKHLSQINNIKKEISELEIELEFLSKIKMKPIQESLTYMAIGQLKSMLPQLKELLNKLQNLKKNNYDYAGSSEKKKIAEETIAKIKQHRTTIVSYGLNKAIQYIFDQFNELEYFKGCKTRYERKHERLELSDGKSILNYNNIGSQSNYMFLHICFFLGLHKFLQDNPCDQIGSFLFIDQPSIPYYEASDDSKSTDKSKLKDAFNVINNFITETIESNNNFQIILIEHADESYWSGSNQLNNFITKANFDGDNALVPYSVIDKKRNERNKKNEGIY